MTEPALDIRRRRLLYRATHRGTQENDLLIGGYVRRHLAGLTESQVAALEALMDLPDTDLGDWLMGRLPIPDGVEPSMLDAIRAFALAAGKRP